jgi:cyclohexanone monooxygenase
VVDELDVLVVGAGFAGICALHHLRGHGLNTLLVEAGGGVGGTWYWNRYPGARVDVESLEYSYGFDDALQQEWHWPEKYSAQPDVRRYLEWVTDRLGLRDHMRFRRRVTALTWHDQAWEVGLDTGERLRARFVVLATGFLSTPNLPDIPGLTGFQGVLAHTGAWPHEGVALAEKRVGVIGTAASGVQVIQETAPVAARLTVFQRTANWCLPLRNAPMSSDYEAFVKANYPEIRRLARDTPGPGMVLMGGEIVPSADERGADASAEERVAHFERRWRAGGVHMGRGYRDLVLDQGVNDSLREFLAAKIREVVHDPVTARALIPDHPPLTRRPPGESGYYAAFNRHNVELVDIRADPIAEVTATGVTLESGRHIELDVLICATGFDSGTGAALRIDVRGRDGFRLADAWADGARTHLGMTVAGFPNLFLLNGPQSPGAHFSPPVLADHQTRHVIALIDAAGAGSVEPRADAQDEWVEHANSIYARTLIWKTDSWWVGANIPGKPRQAVAYAGGFPAYRARCEQAFPGEYSISGT